MAQRRTLGDPPFWPKAMTLESKLSRLKILSPSDYRAIEMIVEDALRYRWWQIGKSWVKKPPTKLICLVGLVPFF